MSSVYSLSGISNIAADWYGRPTVGQSLTTLPPSDDPKDVSTVPDFSQIEELKGANPTEFQQVVTDAVAKLKLAASQTSDPFASSYLWTLANQFQLTLDATPVARTDATISG
jgi:hypothetical protein